ncbi:hypothetical protein ACFWUU_02110 [Kribbella sp. NPDC058693]|uniref:hypothetical protein n=1 Tax=Kribbella sp. NPDC058693 TaxID=3346602 RepID=UPI003654BC61
MELSRRSWVPDIELMAQQLIADVRTAETEYEGNLDAVGTFNVFEQVAAAAGEELQPDDYQSLAILLARMCAGFVPMPDV